MLENPTFWVAFCFVAFFALLYYFNVHKTITNSLDKRANTIRSELEEAQRMREEAQSLLADYQRKQKEAEATAEDIIAQAKKEADSFAEETRLALQASLERRTRLAEEKIARAEAEASAEVRAAAIDIAVNATEKLIAAKLTSSASANLIDQSIQDVKAKLN